MLDNGADIEATKVTNGMTALITAAANIRMGTLGVLIARGADIEAPTFDGKTKLILTSLLGYVKVVELLLKNGADTMPETNSARIPVHPSR